MTELLSEKERERFRAHNLLSEGKSEKFVAAKLKKSVRRVRRQQIRFEESGNFEGRPRKGAPKKLDDRDVKRLVKEVKGKERKSTRKKATFFKK